MSVAGHHLPIWFDEATGPDDGDVSVWNSATQRFESAPVVGGAIPDGTYVPTDGEPVEVVTEVDFATAPTVPNDAFPQAKVVGLVPALAAKKDKATYEIDLRDHGWTGLGSQANDRAALDSGLAAAHAATAARGVSIKLVPGRLDLTLGGATVPITRNNLWIDAAEPEATLLLGGAGTMFTWGDGVASPYGGGIRGCGVSYPSAPDAASKVVDVAKANRLSFLDLTLDNVRQLASLGSGASALAGVIAFERIYGTSDPAAGSVVVDARHGSGLVMNNVIMNAKGVGFPTDTTSAHPANATTFLRFGQGSWDTALCDGVITNRYDRGLDIDASTAVALVNFWFAKCIFDYSKTNGIRVQTNHSGANVRSVLFDSCWAVATDGHSIQVDGTLGVMAHVHFTDTAGRQGGKNNWRLAGSVMSDVRLLGCFGIGANRLAATNTGSDQDDLVLLGTGVHILGGQFGEDGSSYTGFACQGRYGVNVSANLSEYTITAVKAFGATQPWLINPNTGISYNRRIYRNIGTSAGARPVYATTTTESTPASNVAQTHFAATADKLYIYGGTVTSIQHNGSEVATSGPVTLVLEPGDSWMVIYSVAPTIKRMVSP